MSIVDTCFLIDLVRGDAGAMKFAEQAPHLSTTSISAAEFLYGAQISAKSGVVDAARAFLAHFPILPFDSDAAAIYADIAAGLKNNGNRISSFDELIAAIALCHGGEIVSRDIHFSEIPGLSIVRY